MFKGSMANYYHEARAHARKLKDMQEENKRRAERRAEVFGPHAEDPLQSLIITGRPCNIHKNTEQHAANEKGDGMIPWNGLKDNMIDRFDGRALLDFYRDPPAHQLQREKTHEESKLEELLHFEAFRDLIRLVARGTSEARGLALVEAEALEKRAAQHAAMQAAAEAAFGERRGAPGALASGPGSSLPTAPGTGIYSAMGFNYEGEQASVAFSSSSSDSEDSESSSEGEEEDEGPVTEAEVAQEAEDERVDSIAEQYGLTDFCYRLHKMQEREGEQEVLNRRRPRRNMGRKKAAARARRMAGMGLDPHTGLPRQALQNPYKDTQRLVNPWLDPKDQAEQGEARDRAADFRAYQRRGSPTYGERRRRSRSRSRSGSPRGGVTHFITEFSSAPGAADGQQQDAGTAVAAHATARQKFIDALPDRPDPAMLGGIKPVTLDQLTVQGKRRDASPGTLRSSREGDRDRHRSRSRSRGRRSSYRSSSRSRSRQCEAPPPWRKDRGSRRSRSSSRDRGRGKGRSRSRSRDRERGDRQYSSSGPRGRSREREQSKYGSIRSSKHKSRSRSGDPSRVKETSGYRERKAEPLEASRGAAGGSSGSGVSKGVAASGAAKPAAALGGPKESAQERMKRLMAAQLNKAFQKDALAATHKKMQEEKDKVARQQIQRVTAGYQRRGSSPSPEREYYGSSPPRHRRKRSSSPQY